MTGHPLSVPPPPRWIEETAQRWLRPFMVAAVLLCSAYLGWKPLRLRLLGVLVGGLIVPVFLRWPEAGLATLIVVSLTVPFAIGTGTQSTLNATILLLPVLIGLWVLDMLARRELRLVPSRPILPLLLFVGVALVAFAVGAQPWLVFAQTASLEAQLGGLSVFVLSAGAFLLMGHRVRDITWLRRLTWLFLAIGALYIAGWLVPGLDRYTARVIQRGAAYSPFWLWMVALAGGQALFDRSLGRFGRLTLGGLALATVGVGFFLNRSWISGWLPSLVALAVLFWLRSWRVGLLVSVVAFVVLHQYAPDLLASLAVQKEYSADTRLVAWQILTQDVIPLSPLIGLGPANYYWYTPLFPILGWYVSFNSHNNYLDIVAQTGLLGLACFLWFVGETGRLGWRLRRRVPAGFGQAYVYAALGGLAGTLVSAWLGDWVLPFVYNITLTGLRASVMVWLFLGGLVSLEQIVARNAPGDASPRETPPG